MHKKIMLVIFVLFTLLALSGCVARDGFDPGFRVLKGYDNVQIIYDKTTGVMYWREGRGGFYPIYNADGSLRIYEQQE